MTLVECPTGKHGSVEVYIPVKEASCSCGVIVQLKKGGRPRRTESKNLYRAQKDRARKRAKRLVRPAVMSAETPSQAL